MKKENNKFMQGAFLLTISVILTKIFGMFFKVPLSYILNDEGMGYFNTAYTIYGFFYIICTAGVPKAMSLVISEYNAREKSVTSDKVLANSIGFFFKIGIISTILNIICAPVLVILIGNKSALYTVLAVSPSIVFSCVAGALRGYLNSEGKLGKIAVSQLLEAVFKLFVGLFLAWISVRLLLPLPLISAFSVLGITIGSIVSFIYLIKSSNIRKNRNNYKQNDKLMRFECRNKIVKTAFPLSASSAILNLTGIVDTALIIRGISKVGLTEAQANSIYGNYSTLALPMLNMVIALISPIALAYLPKLSDSYLNGNSNEFKKKASELLNFSNIVSILAACSFAFYSFDILDLLFSSNSSAIGAELLSALSLSVVLLSSLTVVNTVLESVGRVRYTIISLSVGSIIKMLFSYILITKCGYGIMGAPLATAISYAVSLSISVFISELCGLRLSVFKNLLINMAICAFSFIAPYRAMYIIGRPANSFLRLCLCCTLSVLLYFIFILIISFIPKFCRKIFKMHKNNCI